MIRVSKFVICIFSVGLLAFGTALPAQSVKARFYQPIIPTIKWPSTISAIGDVNDDGRQDVLIGTGYNTNSLGHFKLMVHMQNDRNRINIIPFSYSVNGDTITTIEVGNLTDDYKNDVLVGAGNEVAIFVQDTSIKLTRDTLMYSGRGVRDVQIGDLNQDGKNDFVVFHARESYVRVFYQTSDGTFNSQSYACQSSPRGEVAIADINSDGLLDILVMTSQPPALHTLHGKGQQQFDPPISLTSATPGSHTFEAMAIADFFQDDLSDIAISRNQGDSLRQIEFFSQTQNGLQHFTPAPYGGECLNAADLNCDGIPELYSMYNGVFSNYVSNPFRVYYFDQTDTNFANGLTSEPSFTYGSSMKRKFEPGALSHGDINSDGITDIVIADTANGMLISYNKTNLQPRKLRDSIFDTDTTVSADTLYTTTNLTLGSTLDTFFGYYLRTAHIRQIKNTLLAASSHISTSKVIFKTYCSGSFNDTAYETEVVRDTSIINSDTTMVKEQTEIKWQQQDFDRHLTFYPNPSTGHVFIEILKANNLLHNLKLSVYGSDGKHVSTQYLSFTGKGEMDLSDYPPGTYLIAIEWLGREFDRRIIKH